MINVTRAYLPPIEEYQLFLKRAWDNKWLTNRGELLLELEEKLKAYLGISNIIITTNGTIPLQIALKLLGNGGEIITTPFSYVATTSAIVWEHCKPVFVDIDPDHLTIDETAIEAAITEKTTAILATHVFGNPCNIEAIDAIAKKHNLKIIYDAAHAFGVRYNGKSVFECGDISTTSFHATKLFHTGEGGAMFSNDPDLNHQLYFSHNFGHNGPLAFHGLGINGKTSELQAAMGLAMLPYMESILRDRKAIVDFYQAELDFSKLNQLKIRANTDWNYSYFPVIFQSEEQLLKTESLLNANQIIPRRYFYPSLNTIPYAGSQSMPVSESISSRVLCLPLYPGLEPHELRLICDTVNESFL